MISALQYATRHVELLDATYNGVQAWCTRRANGNPRFFTLLNGWKKSFILADLSSLAWTLRLTVTKISFLTNIGYLGTGALVFLSAAWISEMAAKLSRKEVHQALNLPNTYDVTNISLINSDHDILKRLLLATRAITNVSLAILFPYNPLYLLSAGLELYTLILLVQRTWVRFSREERLLIDDSDAERVKMSYDFLIRKVPSPIPDDQNHCEICYEEMHPSTTTFFCDYHLFHMACIVAAVQKRMSMVNEMLHVRSRRPILHSAAYTVTLDDGAIPNCPGCRKGAPGDDFRVSCYDKPSRKWCPATITTGRSE